MRETLYEYSDEQLQAVMEDILDKFNKLEARLDKLEYNIELDRMGPGAY